MKNSSANRDARNDVSADGDGGVSSGTVTLSKKVRKQTYEKQLEDISKDLQLRSHGNPGSSKGSSVKKQRLKPEQEMILLEQKCVLLLRLKRHKEVLDEGYSILGRMGPLVVIYKCILIALVRLGKTEDDIVELLQVWKKAIPKCPHFIETKRIFDGYFAALRSGMKRSDIFSSIEDAISLNVDTILSKQAAEADSSDDKRWRFRAPPPRYTTFSMCPRCSSGNSDCIYGVDCLFAHTPEELKEWTMRAEGDNKRNNNHNHTLDDDEEVDSFNKLAGKKRPVPNSYRSLLIPPLCIYYLQSLGKKIKEASDIKDVLTDDVSGVKITTTSTLNFQRFVDGINKVQCTWTFMVISKMPMATVTILHDANRECFRISTATYYNKRKDSVDLIELHPNNKVQTKLQVLNTFIQPSLFLQFNGGWPDVCCYKIEMNFESRDAFPEPGLYRQSIIFDFKKDPKAVKNVTVEVVPKREPSVNHVIETQRKSVWGMTPLPLIPVETEEFYNGDGDIDDQRSTDSSSTSTTHELETEDFVTRNSDFPTLQQCLSTRVNVPSRPNNAIIAAHSDGIFDSESGKLVSVRGMPTSAETSETNVKNKDYMLLDPQLTRENYSSWMRNFLKMELAAREEILVNFKKVVEVRILGEYTVSSDCLHKYPSTVGEVYGKIEAFSCVFSCNTKLERFVSKNCSNITISSSEKQYYLKPSKRYICKIVDRSKTSVIIAIGRKAADDLLLISNSTRKLQLQFVLDYTYIDRIKFCLACLKKYHMEFLFPRFEEKTLPILRIQDGVGMINEEEQDLNIRQSNFYSLLTGRRTLIDETDVPLPLLLLGGVSTGKTYLIARCIRALLRSFGNGSFGNVAPSRRILVCTHSDFAADQYITDYFHPWLVNDQLSIQRSKPLRVYGEDRFPDTVCGAVKHYCLFNEDGTSFRYPTKDEILSHKIVIVTFSICTELIKLGIENDTFSYIILDNVERCLEVECVQPLVLAGRETKLIISGDVMKTELEIFSSSKCEAPLSLLERLRNIYPFKHPYVTSLIDNYTNNEVIMKFISEVFYFDQLRSAVSQKPHPKYYPLAFHHISLSVELQADNGLGYYNMEEIRYIVEFVDELLRTWPNTWGSSKEKDSIAIFTPYYNQVLGLQVQLRLVGITTVNVKLLSNVTGKKYKVVIISTVRSYKHDADSPIDMSDGGFFTDKKLLLNIFSSAKNMIVTFGDAFSLWKHGACSDLWRNFLSICDRNQSLKGLEKDEKGFTPEIKDGDVRGSPLCNSDIVHSSLSLPTTLLENGTTVIPMHKKPATLLHTENISSGHGMNLLSNGEVKMKPKSASNVNSAPVSDQPWMIDSSLLQDPPQTDLFSAFSVRPEPLYRSKLPLATKDEVTNIVKEVSEKSFEVQSYDDDKRVIRKSMPLLNGLQGTKARTKEGQESSKLSELLNESLYALKSKSNLRNLSNSKQLKVYRSPFQLPTVSPTSLLEELPSELSGAPVNNLSTITKVEPGQIHAPPPLPVNTANAAGLELYTKFTSANGFASYYPMSIYADSFNELNVDPSNTKCISKTSFISPLLRGPPGFTQIEPKVGSFAHPKKPQYTSPQHRETPRSSRTSLKFNGTGPFRNNGFEIPPRMLKNLHITPTAAMYRSPTRSRSKPSNNVVGESATEMNFFDELGLSVRTQLSQDNDNINNECDSATGIADEDEEQFDQSFVTSAETVSIVEDTSLKIIGSSNIEDEWTEVKNPRKGKQKPVKKPKAVKGKERRTVEKSYDGESTSMSEDLTEGMCLDDKIEAIVQMGFSKALAATALQSNGKDLLRAVDWLINNPNLGRAGF